jgi:hypothetical protein
LLNSPDLAPYSKLEYLERELSELKEEHEHLKWLKDLPMEEKEWLIRQDFDKLLKLNWQTQLKAREHIKLQYFEIKNNVESIDVEDLDVRKRYGEQEEENNKKREG